MEIKNRCVGRQGHSKDWEWETGEQLDLGKGGNSKDIWWIGGLYM